MIEVFDDQLAGLGTPECRKWFGGIFQKHSGVDKFLKTKYIRDARSRGYKSANRNLGELNKSLNFSGMSAAAFDEEICNIATIRGIQATGIYKALIKSECLSAVSYRLQEFCEGHGVNYPLKIAKKDTQEKIGAKIIAACERVSDERWWRRQLRKQMTRQCEGVLRQEGFVRAGKSPYLSNWAFGRWCASQRRNRNTLERMEAVTKDDDGNQVATDLIELVDKSNANPYIRESELKVRARGFQDVAEAMGLCGALLTLTCPSRYHPSSAGRRNPKYDGSSPRDGVEYLNGVWARIRAAWAEEGIKAFGFRNAEPHADGTPHYHFALFFHPDEIDRAWEIFQQKALDDTPDEEGAKKHRADFVRIDPEKGTMMGYVLKYICKNVTGQGVDWDLEGEVLAKDGAMRATAWASIWGIRQFQQIGSVSVTVWRELRRLTDDFEEVDDEKLKALHDAANNSDWGAFVELMGGPFVARGDQPLRPEYSPENEDVQTQYVEPVKRLIGLWLQPVARALGRFISTRDKVWTIREKQRAFFEEVAQPPPLDLCQ